MKRPRIAALPWVALIAFGGCSDLAALISKSPCFGTTSTMRFCAQGEGAGYRPANGTDQGATPHCCTNDVYSIAESCDVIGSSSTDVQAQLTATFAGFANGRCKIKNTDSVSFALSLTEGQNAEHHQTTGHCETHTGSDEGKCAGNEKVVRNSYSLAGSIISTEALSADCAAEVKDAVRAAMPSGAAQVSVTQTGNTISVGNFSLCEIQDHVACTGTATFGAPAPPKYATPGAGWIYRGPAGNLACRPNADACLNCIATYCCQDLINCTADPVCNGGRTDLTSCLQKAADKGARQACFELAGMSVRPVVNCAMKSCGSVCF
jgi:hypothetical protein